MIPIPVETDAMLAILNLPKEMSNNGIFKEHQGLVLEIIHSLVLQEHYDRATHDDLPEEEPFLVSFRYHPQSFASKVFREPDLPTLPGKVPSWTPIAPLIAWVERKHLSWTDKETGKATDRSRDRLSHPGQDQITLL